MTVIATPPRQWANNWARQDWRLAPAAGVVWLAALAGLLGTWWFAVLIGGVGAVVGLAALPGGRHSASAWALLVSGLLAALPVAVQIRSATTDPLREPAARGEFAAVRIVVTERPRPLTSPGFGGGQGGVHSVLITADVVTADTEDRRSASTGEIVLIAPVDGWAGLLPGQRADAAGSLAPAAPGRLTVAVLRVRGPPADVTEAAIWQRVAQDLRSGLRTAAQVLDPAPAGLMPALVVGDVDRLPPEVVADFRAAGMAHLLAVSGANLAIVCLAVLFVLRGLRVGPRGAAAGALLALAGFVVLAGPEPSVLRAAVMAAIGLLALAIGRERSALPALATAVIVLVAHDPAMAVSFGFVLSVLATSGLVLIAPRWAGALVRRGVPAWLAQALAVPAAAHLVTAPVVAGMTGQVSVVAVLANLLAAPVVAPATVFGVLAAVVAPVWPWLAEVMMLGAGPEAYWLVFLGGQAAALPGATLSWPAGVWGGALLLAVVLAVSLALRVRRLRVLTCAALVALVVVAVPVRMIAPGWPPPGWALAACDVGQGDAAVLAIREPGRAVVVDTGPEPGPVEDCLDRLGVHRVPLVILTHLHADHVGGLAAVLAGRAVGAVAVGPGRAPGWAWAQVERIAADAGVPVVELAGGDHLSWPGLDLDVLGPGPSRQPLPGKAPQPRKEDGTEINNRSLVVRATTSAGRILLTGDIELAAQADLLASRVDLTADVVKVPHHGSRYTAPEFLAATSAGIAVISVGARNRYGHPSQSTLGLLRERAVLVVRTDQGGDLAIVRDDVGPAVVARGSARAPP